jgi:hypothetical protein
MVVIPLELSRLSGQPTVRSIADGREEIVGNSVLNSLVGVRPSTEHGTMGVKPSSGLLLCGWPLRQEQE